LSDPSADRTPSSRRDAAHAADYAKVAHGAGLALLGRMGALIEPISVVIFARLYGPATFGLFILLWSYAQLISIGADFGMTSALQRFVPTQNEVGARVVLRNALLSALTIGLAFAGLLYVLAPFVADYINAGGLEHARVVHLIRMYVWAVPLWTLIEVMTAAIRARQVFGPEIRVRIFYEQGLRLVAGVAFFYAGWQLEGLFAAHLFSLAMASLLGARLISRFYGWRGLVTARSPQGEGLLLPMLHFSSLMVIPNIAKKLHSNLPLWFLNALIPGAHGAAAVGIYAVARKIVSVLQVIRDSFEYVLAPMAAAKRSVDAHQSLREIYAFATRLIYAAFLPAASVLILLREQLLAIPGDEFRAGSAALVILAVGRWLESATGPSTAVISMIGRYQLPVINAFAGMAVTVTLLILLVPVYGITGGAVAAAIGINVTSLAALAEVHFLHRLQPFDHRILRPFLISAALSAVVGLVTMEAARLGTVSGLVTGAIGVIATLVILFKVGFTPADRAALHRKSA